MVGKKCYQKYQTHTQQVISAQYGKKSVKDTQIDKVIKTHRAKKAGKKV